jgi:hypothetical protein
MLAHEIGVLWAPTTFPETLNTKFTINELWFPLVTHMVDSDARFDSYRLLNSGQGDEQILDRLDIQVNDQVLWE